jgi:hypothetical protein
MFDSVVYREAGTGTTEGGRRMTSRRPHQIIEILSPENIKANQRNQSKKKVTYFRREQAGCVQAERQTGSSLGEKNKEKRNGSYCSKANEQSRRAGRTQTSCQAAAAVNEIRAPNILIKKISQWRRNMSLAANRGA